MKSTTLPICVAMTFLSLALSQTIPPSRVTFIRGNEVYRANNDGSGLVQITKDGVVKRNIRWSPDGSRLAYEAAVDRREAFFKFVVISADGKPLNTVREPKTMTPDAIRGARSIQFIEWAGDNRLVVYGDVNPNNCAYAVYDIDSNNVLSSDIVQCGMFSPNSSNTQFAYTSGHGVGAGAPENWRDYLTVGSASYPTSRPSTVRLLTKPVWSQDSSSVAFLEYDHATGSHNVVRVTTGGIATRILMSPNISMPATVRWIGDNLVLESGPTRYLVDFAQNVIKLAGRTIDDFALRADALARSRDAARRVSVAAARQLGAARDEDIDVFMGDPDQ